MPNPPYPDNTDIKRYLGWKVLPWKKPFRMWKDYLDSKDLKEEKALELGAKMAGLSRWLADHYSMQVTASDLFPVEEEVAKIRREYPDGRVEYLKADATQLPFPDNSFRIVIMKSVLASIGPDGEKQKKAIAEIFRVLEPGGALLFAENMRGSSMHRMLRKRFVAWSKGCKYYRKKELLDLLQQHGKVSMRTFGFFTVSGSPSLNKITFAADHLLQPLLPADSNYIVYGVAEKDSRG